MDSRKMNKREFLGASAAFACTAMLPSLVKASEATESQSKDLPFLKGTAGGVGRPDAYGRLLTQA
jgi:hypothetical protein